MFRERKPGEASTESAGFATVFGIGLLLVLHCIFYML
jgi:hypothetical protein